MKRNLLVMNFKGNCDLQREGSLYKRFNEKTGSFRSLVCLVAEGRVKVVKKKIAYICNSCGSQAIKWSGQCPSCKEWNTLEEAVVEAKKKTTTMSINNFKNSKPLQRLSEVQSSKSDRIITKIGEFNRVMGGGIVRDSLTILTAKPGAGKSTLLLQVANDVASQGLNVLYASGEESESQIKNRANRILNDMNTNIWVISDSEYGLCTKCCRRNRSRFNYCRQYSNIYIR